MADKNNFTKIIIIGGIASLVLLFFLLGYLRIYFLNRYEEKMALFEKARPEYFENNDPFITKNPALADDFFHVPILDDSCPSLGPKEARLSIIEFSDFTCKFCQEQNQIIREILLEYDKDVRLVWKSYPDSSPESLRSAVASYCAYQQDKFWEFYDLLFYFEDKFEDQLFFALAADLDLNESAFKKCFHGKEVLERVERDIKEANILGISGVPFFYIGSRGILGEVSKEELRMMIEAELRI